jgi:hypothetical protein
LLPVIAGTPPVLVVVVVAAALLDGVPLDDALVEDDPEVSGPGDSRLGDLVGMGAIATLVEVAADVVDALWTAPTPEPVMTTGMKAKSVPETVCVVTPGKLAAAPLKEETQTAEVVPAREHSTFPVLW